jgi:hypothetical protein
MSTRIMRFLVLTGAALALVAQPALGETAPPSLDAEHFGTVRHVSADIPDCQAGTFTFDASGLATGPYPGSYGESGSSSSAQPFRFAITSPTADIVGAKGPSGLDPTQFITFRFCVAWGDPLDTIQAYSSYEALIRTHAGVFLDQGKSGWALSALPSTLDPNDDRSGFDEDFFQIEPRQPTPFTKQDCKAKQYAALVAKVFSGGTKECRDFVKAKRPHV